MICTQNLINIENACIATRITTHQITKREIKHILHVLNVIRVFIIARATDTPQTLLGRP